MSLLSSIDALHNYGNHFVKKYFMLSILFLCRVETYSIIALAYSLINSLYVIVRFACRTKEGRSEELYVNAISNRNNYCNFNSNCLLLDCI